MMNSTYKPKQKSTLTVRSLENLPVSRTRATLSKDCASIAEVQIRIAMTTAAKASMSRSETAAPSASPQSTGSARHSLSPSNGSETWTLQAT
ncbi:hypothetical protein DPMN_140240 [Dreissena polymorpha]|uniref:Uncharacterized protein n=1 Tax=Dreissena polymorpha TaxID=45954 RepID=A0A9D4G787_DREPO|nr:hypothetical protein DPMN_140240 [Dreissena polymorpha]